MCWLVSQFGRGRLLDGKVILPTEEFFPAPYDHSEDGARILLDQVCRYMDVDPAFVDLFFYSERQPVALNIEVVRPEGGTAGLYREQNGRTTIWLEVSRLADPISVVATCAHELCHAHLLGGGRLSPKEEDHEPLTDLATDRGYQSIASPLIGSGNGGGKPGRVLEIMRDELTGIEFDSEVRIVQFKRGKGRV
jgi:hypothetical protein